MRLVTSILKGLVMTFSIKTWENLEFEIPGTGGKPLTISVPPLDCLEPSDVKKINKEIEETPDDADPLNDPRVNPVAMLKTMLAFYQPRKVQRDAIWALVPRQVNEINEIWERESGATVGESEPSTDSSSAGTD